MAAGWLKSIALNAVAPKTSIIHRIKMNVGGLRPPRSRAVVHASDVTKSNFCPRQWALMDLLKVKQKDEFLSTALEATFDIGTTSAEVLINKWLGDSAIGHWKCKTCGDQRTFCSKPGEGCKKMQPCHWQYVEVNFVSLEFGVSGSIDVMVDLASQKVVATELKIINVDDFEKIKQPLPEHVQRTQVYLKLIADSNSVYKDKINLYEARVFYMSRGYGKKNLDHGGEVLPFKEYIVERNDERILPLLKSAKQIKIFREDENHPIPSGICTLPTDKYAVTCTMCGACFSGTYNAAQPALEL